MTVMSTSDSHRHCKCQTAQTTIPSSCCMFALKICDKETGQQGCAKLTDFEWIVDILVAIIFLKISVLMLVLNGFDPIRKF